MSETIDLKGSRVGNTVVAMLLDLYLEAAGRQFKNNFQRCEIHNYGVRCFPARELPHVDRGTAWRNKSET